MATPDPQTVLLPSSLGSAGNYDPAALVRLTDKDSFRAGRLYLRATLDEIIRIRGLSRGFDGNHYDNLVKDVKSQYDGLLRQQNELASFEKRNWLYKLFKPKVKRTLQAFVNDAFELWDSTMTTSDSMKRILLSTHSTDLAQVNSESVSDGEKVEGLAVGVNCPVTQEAITAIQEMASVLASVNVSADSDSQDGQTSTAGTTDASSAMRTSISTSASSPGSTSCFSWFNVEHVNIINNLNSSAPGSTINSASSESSGSTVDTSASPSVNSTPS